MPFASVKIFSSKLKNISPSVLFKIFDVQLKPILLYGSEIWGVHKWESVERFHFQYCKYVLGVSYKCSNVAVLADCGRNYIHVDILQRVIKYWFKLLELQENRYPKQCYKMLCKLDAVGRHTWASAVKKILFLYGFGYVWEAQGVADKVAFMYTFVNRIYDCYVQNLFSDINSTSSLDFYSHIKQTFCMEPYLINIKSKDLRRRITLLRIGALSIRKNTGRREGIPRCCRFCQLCKEHIIEDELHFLFKCPVFNEIRKKYIPNIPDHVDLVYLYNVLKHQKLETVSAFSHFIRDASVLRNELLNSK